MTVPGSTFRFSDIQQEFGGTAPIKLSEYYKGSPYVSTYQIPAPGQDNIPYEGKISASQFKGIIKTLAYFGPSFSEQNGQLDINGFGTKVPANNSWYNLVSKSYSQFTTGNNPLGYTLKLPSTRANFSNSYSIFWYTNNPNNKWYRYWKTRNFGWRIYNGSGAIHGTYTNNSAEVFGSTGWLQHTTGFHTITNLLPNTTYIVRYYLEFMGENYGGYNAASYSPNGFNGYATGNQDPGPYRLVLIANQ